MGIVKKTTSQDIILPPNHLPDLSPVNSSSKAIKAYVLPDNTTGVVSIDRDKDPVQIN
jgi:hypothetical protein